MENVKRVPYGVSNFVEVVEQNQYYVDKTTYLPLLEQQPSNLFLIRIKNPYILNYRDCFRYNFLC